MGAEERQVWVLGGVAVLGYTAYLLAVVVLGADYRVAMLWTIGGGIVAGIAAGIAATLVRPEDAGGKDQRDREIGRFGDHVGQSMLVIGALAALAMALLGWSHAWIANALYLGFVLSAVLGSMAKLAAYRQGFHPW